MGFLITAFLLGLVGSLHCVGMCGPIALSLPLVNRTLASKIAGVLLYNSGRIITYGLLGILFGLFGKGFIIAGYQQILSVTLGILVLFGILVPAKYVANFRPVAFITHGLLKLKSAFAKVFARRSYSGLMATGLLNGLLPCGLVYTAVAGAIASGGLLSGSLFMILFGLGTLPAMLALVLTGQSISVNFRNYLRSLSPVFTTVVAVLLILRGLNLGVPYLSPQLSKTDCTKHTCCHK